jgi:outer membrane protein assembly factor BamB
MVFIGAGDSSVYALNAKTGTIIWRFKTGDRVESTPLIADKKVYAGSDDGFIYLLAASNGAQLARFSAGYQLSSCALVNNGLIVSGVGLPQSGIGFYKTSALPATAIVKPDSLIGLPMTTYASPATAYSMAVVGSTDGGLSCFDVKNYRLRWNVKTGGNFYMSSPAIADSVVYCAPGDFDPYVYAIDVTDGRVIWKSAGNESAVLAKRTAASAVDTKLLRRFLLSSPDHRALMINRLKTQGVNVHFLERLLPYYSGPLGKKKSAAGLADFVPDGSDVKTSSVALDPNRIYVINKEPGYPLPRFSIIALDRYSGNAAWKNKFTELCSCIPIGYCSSPVVAGNSVFFGWGEGKVYALSADSGTLQWRDSLSGDIVASPAIAEDKLFFATVNGSVYAYNLKRTSVAGRFDDMTYSFPNPVRGAVSNIQVFVTRRAQLTVRFYNSSERQVNVFKAVLPDNMDIFNPFKFQWDVSKTANGVYFALVKVTYDDGSTQKKVLKIAVLK